MSDTCGLTASMCRKCWSEDENRVLDSQCKCVLKAGYPKNGPDLWVSGRNIIKSILKIFEFPKTGNVLLSKIEFRREACCRILEIQKF